MVICFEIRLPVSLVFANPGRWHVVVLSAANLLDTEVPINMQDLSPFDKIVQMKQQKPMQKLSGYKAGCEYKLTARWYGKLPSVSGLA